MPLNVDRETISTLLGYSSILAWLGAQLPQLVENWRNGSVEGLALPFLVSVSLHQPATPRHSYPPKVNSVARRRRYELARVRSASLIPERGSSSGMGTRADRTDE